MNNVILSIHHRHTENILNGTKTVELRKSLPREMPGKVYLYDTQEKKIVGYFIPRKTDKRYNFTEFIREMGDRTGLNPDEIVRYFKGNPPICYYEINFALRFINFIPLPPGIRAPQNFIYCGELHETCEACGGTGYYGDNGPGIAGNTEYCACDQCPAGEGK